MSRINLVLIHTHDTGRHIEPYGAHVPCPNLMNLARKGVLFRKAFSTSPGCSSSRSSLMTGFSPHVNGMIGLAHRGFRLRDVRQHLSHRLREAGYFTKLVGFQHETVDNDLGYHEITRSDELSRHSVERAEVAADWIRQSANQVAKQQPFFLNLGLVETHRPFGALESPDDERYVAPLPFLADDPQVREDLAELNSAVRRVDGAVGIVMEALEHSGLMENTLIVFTTDHGVPFPRAKATLFDAGTGVSLIMCGGEFRGGQVLDALVSQLDFLPTFWEMADLGSPGEVEGVSLLPLMHGEEKVRDHVFTEMTYHAAYDPVRAIRTRRYKYIRYFEELPRFVWPNVDDSPSKDLVYDFNITQPRATEMLFDLALDPQEFENVIDSQHYASVRADLSAHLLKWMEATDDPLLHGTVPPPKDAVVTPGSAYTPSGDSKMP